MQIPFFDLTRQNQILEKDFKDAFEKFLKKGKSILANEVLMFEKNFSTYTGSEYCLSCANATDALEMALSAMKIGHGDEVIVPAFGWVSVVSAVLSVGAKPVFVDVMHDGNIDHQLIDQKISSKTKAVLIIHLYGHPCEVREIRTVCKAYNVKLIEDCAQAHGARVGGIHVGNFGDVGVFSFYPTKNLGAMGDAGAIITNDDEVYHQLKKIRDYGRDEKGEFHLAGRNSRMDELQAAILNVKLPLLDDWVARRRSISSQFNNVLGPYIKEAESVWYKYVFTTEHRQAVINQLKEAGIETGIYYPFQLDQLPFSQTGKPPLAMAQKLSQTTLSLPLFPELTNEEISYICEELKLLIK
ncbi:MAG: DegT/DnrJ/EryC1/StrS family aminotransferase [Cyclobacteriaceae bacterium]